MLWFYQEDDDVIPASAKDWVFGSILPANFTHSRSTAGFGRDANGRWVQFAANTPRTYYDPTSKANLGMLVEPTDRTQYVSYGRSPNLGANGCTITQATGLTPMGNGPINQIRPTTANASHFFYCPFDSTSRGTNPPANLTVTISLVVKPVGNLNRLYVYGRRQDGTYAGAAFSLTGAGTIPNTTGATARITPDTDGYYLAEVVVNTLSGSTVFSVDMHLEQADGTRAFAGSVTDGMDIAWLGVEDGDCFTSPYYTDNTNTAPLLRAADVLYSTSNWLAPGPISLGIECTPLAVSTQTLLDLFSTDRFELRAEATATRFVAQTGNTEVASIAGPAAPRFKKTTLVFAAAQDDFKLAKDGTIAGTDPAGALPTTVAKLLIGVRGDNTQAGALALSRIKYWPQSMETYLVAGYSADLSQTGIAGPTVDALDATASNGDSTIAIPVVKTNVTSAVTVTYQTKDGTALAGRDYIAASGTLTIADGVPSADIPVTLTSAGSTSEDRQFTIELSSPTGASLDGGTATVTVLRKGAASASPNQTTTWTAGINTAWTFTRASAGMSMNSSGIWSSVATNVIRLHYASSTQGGLLLEPATTHYLRDTFGLYTSRTTLATDSATQTPTGLNSRVVRETAVAGTHANGIIPTDQPADNTNMVWWILVKPEGRSRMQLKMKGKDATFKTVEFLMTGAGSITYQDAGTSAWIEGPDPWFGYWRIGMYRAMGAGTNAIEVQWWLVQDDGTTSYTGDVNMGVRVCHCQLETGTIWSSPYYITGATATTTRAQDVLVASPSGSAGAWFQLSTWTCGVKAYRLNDIPTPQRIIQWRDSAGSDDNGILCTLDLTHTFTSGGTYRGDIGGGTTSKNTPFTALVTVNPNDKLGFWRDGVKKGQWLLGGTNATNPNAISTLRLGSKIQDNSQQSGIVIMVSRAFSSALSDSDAAIYSAELLTTPGAGTQAAPIVSLPATLSVVEGTTLSVPVTKTNAGACTVSIATYPFTAGAADFTAISSQTVSFASGDVTKTVSIPITSDSVTEPAEQFTVRLSSPTDCFIGRATCTVTMTDTAPTPTRYTAITGFATTTKGGLTNASRSWYRVTSLGNDPNTQGTLAHACKQSNTMVVFETSGVIDLGNAPLAIPASNITICGETAPSPGILLKNGQITIGSGGGAVVENVILRHVRMRAGNPGSNLDQRDALSLLGLDDGSTHTNGGRTLRYIWVDHCSFCWSTDELLQVWFGPQHHITFSNCIFTEPLNKAGRTDQAEHGYGPLVGSGYGPVDFQKNIFANSLMRSPRTNEGATVTVLNNVMNNWGWACCTIELATSPSHNPLWDTYWSVAGNIGIKGPNSTTDNYIAYWQNVSAGSQVYVSQNVGYKGANPALYRNNNATGPNSLSAPHANTWVSGMAVIPPDQLLTEIINNAGAMPKLWRDPVEQRTVQQVKDQTGKFVDAITDVGGYPVLDVNTRTLNLPDISNETAVNDFLRTYLDQVQYD